MPTLSKFTKFVDDMQNCFSNEYKKTTNYICSSKLIKTKLGKQIEKGQVDKIFGNRRKEKKYRKKHRKKYKENCL